MTEQGRKSGAVWGAVGWGVGVLALLVALPLAASGRLPDRLATHWDAGSGRPDDSMPLWAAALFPALIWGVLAFVVVLTLRRAGAGRDAPGWAAAGLGFVGVTLLGGQASIVRANLDRADWHQAGSVTSGVVGTLVVAVAAGAASLLATRRAPDEPRPAADGPTLDIPAGQRVVWLARTSNSWLHALAALTGLLAITVVVSALAGLTGLPFLLGAAPFAFASLLVLGCSSVRARVGEQGLDVAFGPFGWPARHWAAEDIESARVENRTPAQVGGWGYRLSGLGTTVMLRGGECLVIRPSRGREFAVSVDDAERGAALLNSLSARHAR
ncbi:DUF1648 domain-containing protein [Streptomyces mirabilis]|uniref:DUF1648 domain-containing protein n=1 Tax=Streptomyces mirabilis TaxID=68239 RepID=UPI001BAE83B0|nr:DUF1648 domain-containing protein [Streptomyces mirabilis]QUW81839.1 DUF1648 domain-containing protein [Streptomyces mirabilis]